MCILGRSAIGVSRQPIRSRTVSLPSRAATICEPHWVQKYRVLPGEDSKPLSRPSPLVQRKRSRGTLVAVKKDHPCLLPQVRHVAYTHPPPSAPPPTPH